MTKKFTLFLFCLLSLFSKNYAVTQVFKSFSDEMYVFNSVNVITGEYVESQNDLLVIAPDAFSVKRSHTRPDLFKYGWQINLPNLMIDPIESEAGNFFKNQLVSYTYDKNKRLTGLKITDHHFNCLYNELKIGYTDDGCEMTTSDDRHLKYKIHNNLITEVISSYKPSIKYIYRTHPKGEGSAISKKELPDGRYIELEYYEKGHPDCGKVKKQKNPLGNSEKPYATYQFFYGKNSTSVLDAMGSKTLYYYSSFGRITDIENYDSSGNFYRKEKLHWTKTNDGYQISSRYIIDEDQKIHTVKNYQYNSQGLLEKETLYGNLTGLAPLPIVVNENGIVISNNTENYSSYYTYKDGEIESITEDNHKKVVYKYANDNISAKFIYLHDKVFLREFYFYNSYGQLIEKITDDGSSSDPHVYENVTERHIERKTYRTTQPAIGLLESDAQYFEDLSKKTAILLNKTVYIYNKQFKIVEKQLFDANHQYIDSIVNHYNERGELISTKDEEKRTTIYSYDANQNVISNTVIENDGTIEEVKSCYDFSNRLISNDILSKEGFHKKINCQYDLNGNKTSIEDTFSNITNYCYDDWNREIKKVSPVTYDADANITQQVHLKKYNVYDQLTEEIDPNGNSKVTSYNARGTPLCILINGVVGKSYQYNLDGTLKSEKDAIGSITHYERDAFNRIHEIKVMDKKATVLKKTSFIHNAFHLLTVVESSYGTINYSYDFAGRVSSILEPDNKKSIEYVYDAQGRQIVSKERVNEICITTRKEYDKSKIIKTHITGNDGVSQTIFDKPTPEKNPHIIEESFLNDLNQTVLKKTTIDEKGLSTTVIHDALYRPVVVEKIDPFGKTIFKQELSWDKNNNKTRVVNYNFEQSSSTTIWKYNQNNQLVETCVGINSPNQKRTLYEYNDLGLVSRLKKPDGVTINYEYTETGLLSRHYSSDSSIDYNYQYNSLNQIVEITDDIYGTSLKRSYKKDGKLLEETLGNGLSSSREYDLQNRCIALKLFDESAINYHYNSLYLNEIERVKKNGETYLYTYKKRNDEGKILSKGFEQHYLDDNNKLIGIQTPFFSEEIEFDENNNISKSYYNYKNETISNVYSHDILNQLILEKSESENTFSYDWQGHRLKENDTDYQYNSIGELTQKGFFQYAYDLNGNLLEYISENGPVSLEYDALNRLNKVKTSDGNHFEYRYDAFHRRILKISYNTDEQILSEEKYIYDDLKEIGSLNTLKNHFELRILGEGLAAEIGASVAIEIDDNVYLPIHDHRGTICVLVDAKTSDTVERLIFDAFGNENSTFIKISPWRFSSKRYDGETGFIYFGKRFYSPSIGRFITEDPLFDIEGSNTYGYVSNNPLSRIDPYGLFSFDTFLDFFRGVNHFVNNHLSLDHQFKNKIEGVATSLFGCATLNLWGFHVDKQEVGVFGKGEINGKVRITLINGILNARYDLTETLEMLSEYHQGNNIHYIFRPTEGWTKDFIKSFFVKCGWKSPQAKQLATRWKELIEEMGGVNGGGKIIHYAHSIGATDTSIARNLLSDEELAMIQVYTLGSPTIVENKGFQSVTNYISKGDSISYLDPIRLIKALLNPSQSVIFLKSSWGVPFIDHQLAFPSYRSILEMLGKQFLETYGSG